MSITSIEAINHSGKVFTWTEFASKRMLELIKLEGLTITKINGRKLKQGAKEAKSVTNHEKKETIEHFTEACYVTLQCWMCDEKLQGYAVDAEDVAESAWNKGWRFQNDVVLCQYCTDNKR